jgi:hypothetical protein
MLNVRLKIIEAFALVFQTTGEIPTLKDVNQFLNPLLKSLIVE